MTRFVEGEDRTQSTLFPERLDDYITEDNAIRVIEAFVEALDLKGLGFERHQPRALGRPAYDPATLLKLYIYGYLNRLQSSRRLERETQRNVEVMWLTRRLMPDHKTIANFRKDNGKGIVGVCREWCCRRLKLFAGSVYAIDASSVNSRGSRRLFEAKRLASAFSLADMTRQQPSMPEAKPCRGSKRFEVNVASEGSQA